MQPEQRYPFPLPLGSISPGYEAMPSLAPDVEHGASSVWMHNLESDREANVANFALPEVPPTVQQGVGTLLMGRAGRSKFLGPTAGSEWLHDVSLREQGDGVLHKNSLAVSPRGLLRHSKKMLGMKSIDPGFRRPRATRPIGLLFHRGIHLHREQTCFPFPTRWTPQPLNGFWSKFLKKMRLWYWWIATFDTLHGSE